MMKLISATKWHLGAGCAVLLCACTFTGAPGISADGGVPPDGQSPAIDAPPIDPPPALTVVAGIPRSAGCGTDSTADDCDLTIDTTGAGSITLRNGAAWTDAALTSAQQANAPDLATLQLGQVTIQDEARLRVIGDKPLVIQASGDIVLNGVIYVNAVGLEPGANGGPPGQVPPGGATIAMNCQGKQGAPNGN
ncbi:MAG: hypothetical protein MJE77_08255, partial [Proteobacteria bacterium]|nr:hypothetical protein [Pseudomonadota bacterium]